jgi:hypothetical protein
VICVFLCFIECCVQAVDLSLFVFVAVYCLRAVSLCVFVFDFLLCDCRG